MTATAPSDVFWSEQPSGFDGKGPAGFGIDPLLRREIRGGLECFAEQRREARTGRFDRLIQSLVHFDPEHVLGRRIEPTNRSLFIGRNNPRRDRPQQCLSQRLLQRDFLVEKRVLEHSRNMFTKSNQAL